MDRKLLIGIILLLCLNGCAIVGEGWLIGGRAEWHENGQLKSLEAYNPVKDVVNINAVKN